MISCAQFQPNLYGHGFMSFVTKHIKVCASDAPHKHQVSHKYHAIAFQRWCPSTYTTIAHPLDTFYMSVVVDAISLFSCCTIAKPYRVDICIWWTIFHRFVVEFEFSRQTRAFSIILCFVL